MDHNLSQIRTMKGPTANLHNAEPLPPVLLFFGQEDLLVEEAAQHVWNRCTADDPSGMNSDLLDGDRISADMLVSIARSFPMMGNQRVVWVRHAEKLQGTASKAGSALEQYLTAPVASTILILTASLPSLDGISALAQRNATAAQRKISSLKFPARLLVQHSAWCEFAALSASAMASWLIDRSKQQGLDLSPRAAEFFVARGTGSLREAALEFEKLTAYVGQRTTITEDDVLAVVGGHRVYNSFELQKAFGRRDVPQMILIITKMLEAERQELLILTMLQRYVTALYRMVEARQHTDRAMIAQAAGIAPFLISEYMDATDRLGPALIERSLHELRIAERTIKSSSTSPLLVLERMISRIFAM